MKLTEPIPCGPSIRDEYGKVINGKRNWLADKIELYRKFFLIIPANDDVKG